MSSKEEKERGGRHGQRDPPLLERAKLRLTFLDERRKTSIERSIHPCIVCGGESKHAERLVEPSRILGDEVAQPVRLIRSRVDVDLRTASFTRIVETVVDGAHVRCRMEDDG